MTRRTRLFLEALEDRRTPSFSPAASFPVGASPLAVVTGDFNGDGHLYLATANPGSHSVSVLLGDGAGGFGAAIDSAGTTNDAFERASVTVADFNNDGHLDLATAMYGYNEYGRPVLGGTGPSNDVPSGVRNRSLASTFPLPFRHTDALMVLPFWRKT